VGRQTAAADLSWSEPLTEAIDDRFGDLRERFLDLVVREMVRELLYEGNGSGALLSVLESAPPATKDRRSKIHYIPHFDPEIEAKHRREREFVPLSRALQDIKDWV
jgi:hypothetical protein